MKKQAMRHCIACFLALLLYASVTTAQAKRQDLGDVNGNGAINSFDALLVLQFSVQMIELTPAQRAAADVSRDGQVNSADALQILCTAVFLREVPQWEEQYVAMTFCELPENTFTTKLLDLSAETGAHFTFFVSGNRVRSYHQGLLQRMIDLDCEIGNRSYSDDEMGIGSVYAENPQLAVNDAKKCSDCIVELVGEAYRPKLYQDVLMSSAPEVYQRIGLPIIRTAHSSVAFSTENNGATLAQMALYQEDGTLHIQDGDIISLSLSNSGCVEAAKQIVTVLQEEGFTFVTVSELIEIRGGVSTDYPIERIPR